MRKLGLFAFALGAACLGLPGACGGDSSSGNPDGAPDGTCGPFCNPFADAAGLLANLIARGGGAAPVPSAEPAEPSGSVSFADAIEKQLGLKLEKHKRPEPVLVIDHIDEKPAAN